MNDSYTDHYELLQISPNAHVETIHRVYRLLALNYHPDNTETGDVEMFNQVLEAYRILSDPERRAAYDVEHRTATGTKWKIFDQNSSVQGIEAERRKRTGILSLLCTKRINEPHSPSMSVFDLEGMLGCPREHLELSLWYLKESHRIVRADNGRYVLTAKGLETLEENADAAASRVRMLNPASKAMGQ